MNDDPAPDQPGEALTEREKVALFIGENADRYMPYYDYHIATENNETEWIDQNGVTRPVTRPFTFNIACLFIPLVWTLYRKDLMLTLVWFGITCVLMVLNMGGLPNFIQYAVAFGYALLFDSFYVANVIGKVRNISKRGQYLDYEKSALKVEGGTSGVGAGVGAAIYIGIIVLAISTAFQMLS